MNNSAARTPRISPQQAGYNIIEEAMHRLSNRQTAPAAACAIPPLNLQNLGIQRFDLPPSSWGARVKVTNEGVQRRRFPVISRSPLDAITRTPTGTGTHACNTSAHIPECVNFDQEAACTLLMMKVDGHTPRREKSSKVSIRHPNVQKLIDQERFMVEQEVYLEADRAYLEEEARRRRFMTPAVAGRSILAVSSINSRSLGTADRRRRIRHGMPSAISFGAMPRLHSFAVRPGNRLHGLPAGAVRSTKHMRVPRGAGAL